MSLLEFLKNKIKQDPLIVFYTSVPRLFRTSLIGSLWEISQDYDVVLLSEELDDKTQQVLQDQSAFPRLKKNIALAMVDIDYSEIGNKFEVTADDKKFNCTIVEKPFYDPKKKIASS